MSVEPTPPATRSKNVAGKDKKPVGRALSDPGTLVLPHDVHTAVQQAVKAALLDDRIISLLADRLADKVSESLVQSLELAHGRIDDLTKQVDSLTGELKLQQQLNVTLRSDIDNVEQYQRRSNLRIFGIKESNKEDTDKLILDLCQKKLNIHMDISDIDRSHRVGRRVVLDPKTSVSRPRPIIVKFTTYKKRKEVFNAKKHLKGSGVTVKEDLTATRLASYQDAVTRHGLRNVWTIDGRVCWRGDRRVDGSTN